MLSSEDRALAMEFRRRQEAAGVPVSQMIVSGSQVRVDARVDSNRVRVRVQPSLTAKASLQNLDPVLLDGLSFSADDTSSSLPEAAP